MPLAGAPANLRKYCIDIAAANLVIWRGVLENDPGGNAVIERAKTARRYLEKVTECAAGPRRGTLFPHGGIAAAAALMPEGINDGHIETLRNAGYVNARQIIGLNGIYVTSGQMMSEEGSDYTLVERRRVMDKACRLIRKARLIWVNDAVRVGKDGSPEGIKTLLARSESPLKIMITNGEISAGSVAGPEGRNILSTATLKLKVRIAPLGKLPYIENEPAFSNLALGGAS